jgi:hypothetical protein
MPSVGSAPGTIAMHRWNTFRNDQNACGWRTARRHTIRHSFSRSRRGMPNISFGGGSMFLLRPSAGTPQHHRDILDPPEKRLDCRCNEDIPVIDEDIASGPLGFEIEAAHALIAPAGLVDAPLQVRNREQPIGVPGEFLGG